MTLILLLLLQGRPSADRFVTITAAPDTTTIRPGGRFHLAFVFQLQPGWHTYWENPGATGAPTEIRVEAPEGFRVGKPIHPRPAPLDSLGQRSFGYEHRVILFVPVTAPEDLPAAPVRFRADLSFLVCKDVCLRGRDVKEIRIPAPVDPALAAEIRRAREALPRPLADLEGAKASHDGTTLVVTGPAGDHDAADWYPLEEIAVAYGKPRVTIRDGRFRLEVPAKRRPNLGPGAIRGLVVLGTGRSGPAFELSLPGR